MKTNRILVLIAAVLTFCGADSLDVRAEDEKNTPAPGRCSWSTPATAPYRSWTSRP